jgi:hypothetical protein
LIYLAVTRVDGQKVLGKVEFGRYRPDFKLVLTKDK